MMVTCSCVDHVLGSTPENTAPPAFVGLLGWEGLIFEPGRELAWLFRPNVLWASLEVPSARMDDLQGQVTCYLAARRGPGGPLSKWTGERAAICPFFSPLQWATLQQLL